jgi:anaerobic ribonucleoside-triphosphate reductase
VFDEDKSVKWNREEVIRVNNEYKAEEDRLREIRNQSIDDARYKIYKHIAQETNLSIAQASVFWNYVYDKFNKTLSGFSYFCKW